MTDMKYCKAITQSGKPCINKRKRNCTHCRVHDKRYNSCDICMDNMYKPIKLSCDHVMCSACSTKWTETSCPFCRRDVHKDVAKELLLSNMFNKFYEVESKDEKLKIYAKLMEMLFDNFHLLKHHKLRTIISKKIKEHKDFDFFKRHNKLLESSLEKLNI